VKRLYRVFQGLKNWHNYLLPAGHSEKLDMKVTQTCNYDWDTSFNPCADFTKWRSRGSAFTDKKVAFVGKRFLPYRDTAKGKEKADGLREASSYLPKIALAMGAAVVDAGAELDLAGVPLSDHDFIVLPDGQNLEHTQIRPGSKVRQIDVSWLKEYLVSSIT
jgi:hypothetical protein